VVQCKRGRGRRQLWWSSRCRVTRFFSQQAGEGVIILVITRQMGYSPALLYQTAGKKFFTIAGT